MNLYLRAPQAQCNLGPDLDSAVTQLLAGPNRPGERHFGRLDEPVTIPYCAIAEGPETDFYQRLQNQLEQTLDAAGLSPDERGRTALLIGSSSFDVQVSERGYREALDAGVSDGAIPMPIIGYGKLAERFGRALGLSLYRFSYATACTSSANAMLYAGRLIETGCVDHALVLGTEIGNDTSLLGFHGLGLLAPSGRMRPFDAERDGLVLGEGLGSVLISAEARTPRAERRWRLAGGAMGTDNHSLTAAHPGGGELYRIMAEALADSGVSAADIGAVKVHGTASLKNDEAEAAALTRLFDGRCPPAFALKPHCGHTLGACGALEAALTLGALTRGQRPANADLGGDASLGVSLADTPAPAEPGYYLFNCFAFGGNNNALVIEDRGEQAP